jgi:uncharacterized caspase-like protein
MSSLVRHSACILCALIIASLSTHAAMASRRVALVIGNAKYEHADTLTNTINDANAMAALFTKAGFDVVDVQRNVGVVDFKRAVREFLTAAANADIAVVYYSGHGIEVGGTNYLIPVDAKLMSDYDIDDEAIALDRVILATQSAKKLSLIILDACRDNPFLHAAEHVAAPTRSVANHLMGVQPVGADTLIAYAAKAGSVSYDGGAGPNSPFTTALVKYLAQPGLDIRIALGKVRDDVLAATANKQEPFVYGSLGGSDISLVPAAAAPKVEPAPLADASASAASDYQLAERVGARPAWESFLAVHPTGFYADLARAQLAKLSPAQSSPPADAAKNDAEARAQAERLAARQVEQRAQDEAIRVKAQQEAALEPRIDVKPAPEPSPPANQATLCKRDEARLARLRVDPAANQVALFARELACEDLRPQLQRLAESVGVDLNAAPGAKTQAALNAPAAPVSLSKGVVQNRPPAQTLPSVSLDAAQTCKHDGEELARLRANPDRESAVRFVKAMKCDDLRPQAARLLESLN